MSQITVCLDDATQALVERAAQAHGQSESRWVADLICQHTAQQWPQNCLDLAGRFTDFPLRGEEEAPQPEDANRIGF